MLHDLQETVAKIRSAIRNCKRRGKIYNWIYGNGRNNIIILTVERPRRITTNCLWWIKKYLIAVLFLALHFSCVRILIEFTSGSSLRWNTPYAPCRWVGCYFDSFPPVVFCKLSKLANEYVKRWVIQSRFSKRHTIGIGTQGITKIKRNVLKFSGVVN